jgi:hypothetical protein
MIFNFYKIYDVLIKIIWKRSAILMIEGLTLILTLLAEISYLMTSPARKMIYTMTNGTPNSPHYTTRHGTSWKLRDNYQATN